MTTIKAIETRYGGHLFRSRLEARWAMFFDLAGIPWQYELEAYELPRCINPETGADIPRGAVPAGLRPPGQRHLGGGEGQ